MSWVESLGHRAEKLSTSLMDGFHAIPNEKEPSLLKRIPSQHRLFNAAGMFGFFMVGTWLRDIMRGFDSKGDDIPKDEVLLPLRFMHGVLHHNPYSDAPHDRWCKVVSQMIPAVFGATGAVMGSVAFFSRNGKEGKAAATYAAAREGKAIGLFEADAAASHSQSWPMRIAAGMFATFSAASGLTVLYGFFLNSAFSLANNRKMFAGAAEFTGVDAFRHFTHTTGHNQFGPGEAIPYLLHETQDAMTRWAKAGTKPDQAELDALAKKLVNSTIAPLMPEYCSTHSEELRGKVKNLFADAFEKAGKKPAPAQEIAKKAAEELKGYFVDGVDKFDPATGKQLDKAEFKGGINFIGTLINKLGIDHKDIHEATLANNGLVGKLCNLFRSDKPTRQLHEALDVSINQAKGGR